uniref:(northern house mosquito) hypothetical protein n=1 Tax=Culex pipiens TaxID=7175 RepID=A0A8D8JMS2_CULPI
MAHLPRGHAGVRQEEHRRLAGNGIVTTVVGSAVRCVRGRGRVACGTVAKSDAEAGGQCGQREVHRNGAGIDAGSDRLHLPGHQLGDPRAPVEPDSDGDYSRDAQVGTVQSRPAGGHQRVAQFVGVHQGKL